MNASTAEKADQKTVVNFPSGLPGLERATRWELVESPDAAPFLWLHSQDQPALSLLVIDPRIVVEDYTPRISRADLSRLETESPAPCVMLAIVTIDDHTATVNMRAPLLINPDSMLGVQVILDDSQWDVRHAITDEPECAAEHDDSRSEP